MKRKFLNRRTFIIFHKFVQHISLHHSKCLDNVVNGVALDKSFEILFWHSCIVLLINDSKGKHYPATLQITTDILGYEKRECVSQRTPQDNVFFVFSIYTMTITQFRKGR